MRQGLGLSNKAIRVHNKRSILTHLAKSGPLSKSELASRTQLSIPAVSKILSDLDAESKIMLFPDLFNAVVTERGSMHLVINSAPFFV